VGLAPNQVQENPHGDQKRPGHGAGGQPTGPRLTEAPTAESQYEEAGQRQRGDQPDEIEHA